MWKTFANRDSFDSLQLSPNLLVCIAHREIHMLNRAPLRPDLDSLATSIPLQQNDFAFGG
jgi:hypothetical protein